MEGCSAKYSVTFVNVQHHRESGLLCCSLVIIRESFTPPDGTWIHRLKGSIVRLPLDFQDLHILGLLGSGENRGLSSGLLGGVEKVRGSEPISIKPNRSGL